MVGVGFRRKGKIRLQASFENGELETAIVMGESLARHHSGEVVVFLYDKGNTKVKILKRIKRVSAGFLWLGRKVIVT